MTEISLKCEQIITCWVADNEMFSVRDNIQLYTDRYDSTLVSKI